MKHAARNLAFLSITLAAVASPAQPPDAHLAVTPKDLIVDMPTCHCVAFRWPISGDDNANAVVTVSYRQSGASEWRSALPLLRINRETTGLGKDTFRCGNLFAGSILSLDPGTSYEARFVLKDPDGGNAEKTVMCRTRAVPTVYQGERQVHVYPSNYAGKRLAPAFSDLTQASASAQPGDVVLIHAGSYSGPIRIRVSGTEKSPIVFRSAGDGEVVFSNPGPSAGGNIVDAASTQNVQFEGLTVRNGYTGIKANGAKNLVVRRCAIEDVNCGIITYTTDAAGWYLADNRIKGRVTDWYPRKESSDTGINVSGSGHVVCYNRISSFWDGISTDNHGPNKPEWAEMQTPPQMDIDISNNDISECLDDGIEADDTLHNIRVMNNRIMNVHTGLSAQPHLGGPIYFVGNALYNITYAPLKLHNRPTGLMIFHNTCLGCSQGLESWPPQWQNATLRNNLFVGVTRYAVETGSPDRRTSLDYDGFRHTDDPVRLIAWSSDGGKTWQHYSSLADFSKATGNEKHGVLVDYTGFIKAAAPKMGHTYAAADADLGLKPGSPAIDAGIVLPTINETFKGRAPDLGCYESGGPVPHYGPRPSSKR